MASLATVQLGNLIDETIDELLRTVQRPFPLIVGATALTQTSTVQLTFQDSTSWNRVSVGDILENGEELLLVTAKSSDATPIYTVSRGYADTSDTIQTNQTGSTLLLNPPWPRHTVRRAILRCFKNSLPAKLPQLVSVSVALTLNTNNFFNRFLIPPADCMQVKRVAYYDTQLGSFSVLDGWTFEDDVPTSISSTGKLVIIPQTWRYLGTEFNVDQAPQFQITYEGPYTWAWTTGNVPMTGTDPTDETSTITLPLAGSNLPVLYATAYLLMGRELTKTQVDQVEEFQNSIPLQQGYTLKLALQAWQFYYQTLDEVRRVQNVTRRRTFRSTRFVR